MKWQNKILSFCIFFLVNNMLFAQDSTYKTSFKRVALTPGIGFQKSWTTSFTIMKATYESGSCIYGMNGLFAGAEFVFSGSRLVGAPKLGYQLADGLLCMRASAICYLYTSKADFRLLPKLGINTPSGFSLCYGYNAHLVGTKFKAVSGHRVSVTWDLMLPAKRKKKE